MTGGRAVMRLAVRQVVRQRWRSLLVVALIALPVGLFTAAAVGVRTIPDTPAEVAARTMGRADVVVPAVATPQRMVASLTARGWRAAAVVTGRPGVVRTTGASPLRVEAELIQMPVGDPLLDGMVPLDTGRYPVAPGEVVVGRSMARRMGVTPGDRLALAAPERTLRVTGIAWGGWGGPRTMTGPDLLAGRPAAGPAQVLVGFPAGTDSSAMVVAPQQFSRDGIIGANRIPVNQLLLLYLLGTLGLMACGLAVAAALAVGARRQLRAIGLLGAVGASPAQRAAAPLVHGALLGAVGVMLGLPGGVLGWRALQAWWEHRSGQRFGSAVVDPRDLVVIAVVAVAVAVGAAALPARLAARSSIVRALAGHRPTPRLGPQVPLTGLLVSAAGCVLLAVGAGSRGGGGVASLVVTVGAALAVIGMVIVTPYAVGLLEGASGRLPGTARLAARGVTRFRARTGPVVAAVMAAGALAIAAFAVYHSLDRSEGRWRPPDRVVTLTASADGSGCGGVAPATDAVRRVLPDAVSSCLDAVTQQVSDEQHMFMPVSAADLEVLGGGATTAAARRALRDGAILAPGPPGSPTVRVRTAGGVVSHRVVPVPALDLALSGSDVFLVDGSRLTAMGLRGARPQPVAVFRAPRSLTQAQRTALALLAPDLSFLVGHSSNVVLNAPQPGGFDLVRLMWTVVLPIAGALIVMVVLVGLALLRADGRDERDTMAAVGAAPAHLRRVQGIQAFLLAGLGQLLALPVGLVCAAIILRVGHVAFRMPWWPVAFLVGVLPVVAAVLGWLGLRTGPPRPVRRVA